MDSASEVTQTTAQQAIASAVGQSHATASAMDALRPSLFFLFFFLTSKQA